jgi:hypothetical protein
VVIRGEEQPVAGRLRISIEELLQGGRGMELGDAAGAVPGVPDVVVPEHLTVRGVEEGDVKAVES